MPFSKNSVQPSDTVSSIRRQTVLLAWFTIIYNFIEGLVAIGFGFKDESVSLFGFGVDSFIEMSSAFIVLWKIKGELGLSVETSKLREKMATRLIGILLLGLAGITVGVSVRQLWMTAHPETTSPGLIVSALSLSFMYFLWKAKVKVANELHSATLKADAYCSLSCMYLSVVLFVGSLFFLLIPSLWWVDSTAAITLGVLISKEGLERIRGEDCCEQYCGSP